jgi:hypothetical protein
MGASQRRKGHDFERWVARRLRETLPGCEAKRGYQSRGGGAEAADVVSTLPYHIECKRGRKPLVRAALEQAMGDAKPGMLPMAVIKDDRGKPFVCLDFEDLLEILQENWELSRR